MDTLLISLHPRHSQNIFAGKKTIELRKTKPRTRESGSILVSKKSLAFRNILIYQTAPTAEIVGYCEASEVLSGDAQTFCNNYRNSLCLDSREIWDYLGDRIGYGIRIRNPKRIALIPLVMMREAGILPPQGYRYLSEEDINRLGVKFNG